MIYELRHPITFRGRSVDSVTVRVPSPKAFHGRSPFVPIEQFNLSKIAGIPVKAAALIDEVDLVAISRLFTTMSDEAKAKAAQRT